MTGRDRTVIIVVALLGAIVGSWMFVISPKRDQAAKLQTKITKAQSTLSSAQNELAQGEAARTSFRGSYATMVRLGEAVPTDDNVPSLIYQLQSAASATGVDFRGLTLDPAPAGETAASTPTTGSGSTASPPPLPPGAAVGLAGFPVEPFTFNFTGNFFHLANFFGRLDRFVVAAKQRLAVSGRLMTLDAISLAPATGGFPQIQATVSATTYLLPATEGLLAGATAAGPGTTSSSQSASTSSTTSSTPPAAVVGAVSAK